MEAWWITQGCTAASGAAYSHTHEATARHKAIFLEETAPDSRLRVETATPPGSSSLRWGREIHPGGLGPANF